ncbi:hypothetical protein POMI540_1386 [Schizosaccharomyces pombe]
MSSSKIKELREGLMSSSKWSMAPGMMMQQNQPRPATTTPPISRGNEDADEGLNTARSFSSFQDLKGMSGGAKEQESATLVHLTKGRAHPRSRRPPRQISIDSAKKEEKKNTGSTKAADTKSSVEATISPLKDTKSPSNASVFPIKPSASKTSTTKDSETAKEEDDASSSTTKAVEATTATTASTNKASSAHTDTLATSASNSDRGASTPEMVVKAEKREGSTSPIPYSSLSIAERIKQAQNTPFLESKVLPQNNETSDEENVDVKPAPGTVKNVMQAFLQPATPAKDTASKEPSKSSQQPVRTKPRIAQSPFLAQDAKENGGNVEVSSPLSFSASKSPAAVDSSTKTPTEQVNVVSKQAPTTSSTSVISPDPLQTAAPSANVNEVIASLESKVVTQRTGSGNNYRVGLRNVSGSERTKSLSKESPVEPEKSALPDATSSSTPTTENKESWTNQGIKSSQQRSANASPATSPSNQASIHASCTKESSTHSSPSFTLEFLFSGAPRVVELTRFSQPSPACSRALLARWKEEYRTSIH